MLQKKAEQPLLLAEFVPLNELNRKQLAELARHVVVQNAKKGEFLFREGDTRNEHVYLVEGYISLQSGQKEISVLTVDDTSSRYPVAHSFPREFSAQAKTRVRYIRISQRLIEALHYTNTGEGYEVTDLEMEDSDDWMTRLLQSAILQHVPARNLHLLMLRMIKREVRAGEVIVREGEDGDGFYLVSDGRCSVTREGSDGGSVELAELGIGDSFGESALLFDERRSSTVTMMTDGILAEVKKKDFVELIAAPVSGTIDMDEAKRRVADGAIWLDIRSESDYLCGHLPSSISMPLGSLRERASTMDLHQDYILCGNDLARASVAAFWLMQKGYRVAVMSAPCSRAGTSTEFSAALPDEQVTLAANEELDASLWQDDKKALEDEFHARDEKLAQLVARYEALELEWTELQQKMQSTEDEHAGERNRLLFEVAALTERLQVAQQDASAAAMATERVAGLEESLAELREQQTAMEQRHDHLIKANEALQRQLETADIALEQALQEGAGADAGYDEHIQTLESHLAEAERAGAAALAELAGLQGRLEGMVDAGEVEAMRQHLAKAGEAQVLHAARAQALQSRCDTLEANAKTLSEENSRLLEQKQEAAARLAEMQTAFEALAKEHAELSSTWQAAEARLNGELTTALADLEGLRQSETDHGEMARLKEQVAALEANLEEVEQQHRSFQALEEKRAQAEKARVSLQAELDEARDGGKKQLAMQRQLQSRLDEAVEATRKLEADVAEKSAEVDRLVRAREEFEHKIDAAKAQQAPLEKCLQEALEARQVAEAANSARTVDHDEALQELAEARERVLIAEAESADSKQRLADLEEQLNRSDASFKDVEGRVNELEGQLLEAETELVALRAERQQAKEDWSREDVEQDIHNSEVSKLERELADREEALAVLCKRYDEIEQVVRDHEVMALALQTNVERLERTSKESDLARRTAQEALQHMQSEVESVREAGEFVHYKLPPQGSEVFSRSRGSWLNAALAMLIGGLIVFAVTDWYLVRSGQPEIISWALERMGGNPPAGLPMGFDAIAGQPPATLK